MAMALGCASSPASPFFGDEELLVVGVDRDAEADAMVREYEAAGSKLTLRLRGEHFSALGFTRKDGLGAVRVLTGRGIALALDSKAGTALTQGARYALLGPPFTQTHDADGDRFEEVFVQLYPDAPSEPCVLVYRVRDSGFVDPVSAKDYSVHSPTEPLSPAWQAAAFCVLAEPEPKADAGSPPAP
jgi:hypothetical protein